MRKCMKCVAINLVGIETQEIESLLIWKMSKTVQERVKYETKAS
jgi:hypothetical protein